MKKLAMSMLFVLASFAPCLAQKSLVPSTPSSAPDYFCTWSIQGYLVNFSGGDNTRAAVNERNIFGSGSGDGWASFFPKIRSDLFFVIDDSWDIPQSVNTGNNEYLGLTELDQTRFPSFKGTPRERLKALTDSLRALGWKGAGGWICAQESTTDADHADPEKYWTRKIKDAAHAGFNYWKVDWGRHDRDGKWRRMLSEIGDREAPNLWIEHAMVNPYIEFSDVFRTYDVEVITSAPTTIDRVANILSLRTKGGIINCEDEPYIAAGLGCAIGIMRYPMDGALPDGRQDMVFPPVARDLKNRMDEVVRAIRWHRIAEPFGVGGEVLIDTARLHDTWKVGKDETWMSRPEGQLIEVSAPARVSRGMALPAIESNAPSGHKPYVLASQYPNGAVAVATVGRTSDRSYTLPRERVSIRVKDLTAPIGIFGLYDELIIEYPNAINKKSIKAIYAQDLAADKAQNVRNKMRIEGNRLIISGELIDRVGLSGSSKGDVSDPGMVIQVFCKK